MVKHTAYIQAGKHWLKVYTNFLLGFIKTETHTVFKALYFVNEQYICLYIWAQLFKANDFVS